MKSNGSENAANVKRPLIAAPIERASAIRGDNIFPGAFIYLLQNEIGDDWNSGGYTDDPDDSGKATKWGVTQKTLAAYRGAITTDEDVRALELMEAREIYRELFWERLNLDVVSRPQIAIAVFDASALMGGTIAAFNAQIACQRIGFGIEIDGIIGPQTLEALNNARVQSWIPVFQECLQKRITRIIARNPKNEKFEAGWRSRVKRLQTLI